MPDYDLNTGPQLAFVPGFTFFRCHLGREHSYPYTFFGQDALQPTCHVSLLGVDRVDLCLPSSLKRGFDFLHQPPFLGIDKALIQVTRSCNQERLTTQSFGIEYTSYQVPESERPVRVSQQGIQGDACDLLVASMYTEGLLDVLLHVLISFLQGLIHLYADDFLPVGRESIGDVFQRHECPKAHQEAAKQQG